MPFLARFRTSSHVSISLNFSPIVPANAAKPREGPTSCLPNQLGTTGGKHYARDDVAAERALHACAVLDVPAEKQQVKRWASRANCPAHQIRNSACSGVYAGLCAWTYEFTTRGECGRRGWAFKKPAKRRGLSQTRRSLRMIPAQAVNSKRTGPSHYQSC